MSLESLIGAPLSTFRVLYKFNGELSTDAAGSENREGWTQFHNPFLGKSAPPAFLQGWEDWHAHMFDSMDECDFKNDILYAVSRGAPVGFVFTLENGVFTTAPAYLQAMARELGLTEGECFESRDVTLIEFARREVRCRDPVSDKASVWLLRLPPNSFSETRPYSCCDGHRLVSYLSRGLRRRVFEQTAVLNRYPFLFKPLRSPFAVSAHLSFKEMEYGRFYKKKILRAPAAFRMLKTSLKQLCVQQTSCDDVFLQLLLSRDVLQVFDTLKTSLSEIFSNKRMRQRIVCFYKAWLENPAVDPKAWDGSLRLLFDRAVPYDSGVHFFKSFLDTTTPCRNAEMKLLFLTSAHSCQLGCIRVVEAVLGAAFERLGCVFALKNVLEFLGSPLSLQEGVLARESADALFRDTQGRPRSPGSEDAWSLVLHLMYMR